VVVWDAELATTGAGEELLAVVQGFPGPALLIGQDDRILATNTSAEALLAEEPDWWADLADWWGAAASGLAGTRSVQIKGAAGLMVIEWSAVALPGGRCLLLGNDTTLERRLRQALTESRQRYKDLVDISSDFAWETGADGRFVFVSPRGALGHPAEALIGRNPLELLIDYPDLASPFESRRIIDRTELWLQRADGEAAFLEVSVKPLYDGAGEWCGARGVCRDLTEQTQRAVEIGRIRNRDRLIAHIAHKLADQVDVGRALEEAAAETMHALGADGCRIHGLSEDGTVGRVIQVGDEDRELTNRLGALLDQITEPEKPAGRNLDGLALLTCGTSYRQTLNGVVGVWRHRDQGPWDEEARILLAAIAERIGVTHAHLAHQERLRLLSECDSLTGLFNRRTFLERLAEMLGWREFGPSALLYVDLDNFKAVNDRLGHKQGDAVLCAVAELIKSNIRPGDLPGRMGGDEFVIWLARSAEEQAESVAHRLLAGIEALRHLSAGKDRPLGFSIGIAVHRLGSGEGVAALIDRADTAMYAAKTQGKGRYRLAPSAPLRQEKKG
jgi:diguanylate cyclase (GGDEF)-like protein/PAS domain S-box-containing protein